jgi:hypothetical protein
VSPPSGEEETSGRVRDATRDGSKAVPRDNVVHDYAVPFRGDVDRIRALCADTDNDVPARSIQGPI